MDEIKKTSNRKLLGTLCGIGAAVMLLRAFCKYICPVTVFPKPMRYFSVLRIRCDESKKEYPVKALK